MLKRDTIASHIKIRTLDPRFPTSLKLRRTGREDDPRVDMLGCYSLLKSSRCILSMLLSMLIPYATLHSVSEVYNLRVSTITSEQLMLGAPSERKTPPASLTTKAVARYREDKQGNEQWLVANLTSLIYAYKNLFARVDGSFGYIREKTVDAPPIITRHTQTDDLLFSVGYKHAIHKRFDVTYTLLAGIPTHKDTGFQFYQFGTGHYGIGGQISGIFKNSSHAWIGAARCVHFFNAPAQVPLDPGCIEVNFALGNLTDLLLAFYKNFLKDHSIEIGYNPTCITNLSTKPALDPILPSSSIRNSWYSIYRYSFFKCGHPMGIGVSASYGFDITPKIDTIAKRNISCWLSYTIKF